MPLTGMVGPVQSQEPGTHTKTPVREAGTQVLEPPPTAFQDIHEQEDLKFEPNTDVEHRCLK